MFAGSIMCIQELMSTVRVVYMSVEKYLARFCLYERFLSVCDLQNLYAAGLIITIKKVFNRPYAKMAAVNFCHREELFVHINILLHCKDQVKRNHCMNF